MFLSSELLASKLYDCYDMCWDYLPNFEGGDEDKIAPHANLAVLVAAELDKIEK